MSSFNRRFLILAAGALAGCGFEPALAPGGAGDAIRGKIRIDDPTDRNTFLFIKRFEERNGTSSGDDYVMRVTIRTRDEGGAINQAQETTRFNVIGTATFSVSASGSERVLTKGTVESFTSYSATGTTVSTMTTERDAKERLMIILADQVLARLTATSRTWAR